MGPKKNCWEVMKCERQPNGAKADKHGVCPSAVPGEYDRVNNGTNGGRFCWRIAGTMCDGEQQGDVAQKTLNCLSCDFFKQVSAEEGPDFVLSPAELVKR